MQVEIIKCHGSGNEFVMVDLVAMPPINDMAEFARQICTHKDIEGTDGVLYVTKVGDRYAMRMFNPDGSEAEMCGNGIRCVARLVEERYIPGGEFTLISGGALYPIRRAENIADGIKAYGVDIEVRLTSSDFAFAHGAESFIGKTIPSLGGKLQFTALNLGNPHIVSAVEEIDMEELIRLGEKVITEKRDFPRGINVSLYKKCGDNAIYVATYERGAGITYSCGTAMTASSTASVLLGLCDEEAEISVYNRGGMVKCCCRKGNGRIVTRLTGNATYRWQGTTEWQGGEIKSITRTTTFDAECEAYDKFVAELK